MPTNILQEISDQVFFLWLRGVPGREEEEVPGDKSLHDALNYLEQQKN